MTRTDTRPWWLRTGDALSQLCNTMFLKGHPNESISGRAYREDWKFRAVIDGLLFFQKDHCKVSFENDLKYCTDFLKQNKVDV